MSSRRVATLSENNARPGLIGVCAGFCRGGFESDKLRGIDSGEEALEDEFRLSTRHGFGDGSGLY
jgi:hypothetical protein